MKYELSKLYESKGIDYNCAEKKENLTLIALFYLTNEQGGEGQLYPASTKVVCPKAKGCRSLKKGVCSLTNGYGDSLNELKVLVMADVDPFKITTDTGQTLWLGKQYNLDRGHYIWFGRTTVYSSAKEAAVTISNETNGAAPKKKWWQFYKI